MVYFPTCIYCDWRDLRGEAHWRHVKILNQFRDLCFTSILLPTTAFGDILFWRVWNKDRELIAPLKIHEIVPFWTQHCMHTVSLIIMLVDLALVRRERPKNMVPGLALLSTFLIAYTVVCINSYMNEEYIYPGLKQFTGFKIPALIAYFFIENLFYYFSQWLIIDMVWGNGNKKMLKVAPVTEKLRSARLGWYGHVMRRNENEVGKRVLTMNVDGYRGRGRPKKKWMDCVKNDMGKRGVSEEMVYDRRVWKEKTYCTDPR
ncbi:androgen-induced gene 1 protein isoform X2 [Bombyx mori]